MTEDSKPARLDETSRRAAEAFRERQRAPRVRPPADRARLVELLRAFRYQSSIGRGERGLGDHHVEALADYLAPLVRVQPERPRMPRCACDRDRIDPNCIWHANPPGGA